MDLVSRGRDVQLKLFLTDTDLLNVFHSRANRFSDARPSEARTPADKPPMGKSNLLACYSATSGTLTLSGVLHDRLPISFVLKPGTRTYGNFIRFILRELDSLVEQNGSDPYPERNGSGDVLTGLKVSLEGKLRDLELESQSGSDDFSDILDVFGSDLEPAKPRARRSLADAVSRRKEDSRKEDNGAALPPPVRSIIKRHSTMPSRRQFRLFADPKKPGPQLISGFLSLEIEEREQPPAPAAETAVLSPEEIQKELRQSLLFLGQPDVTVEGVEAWITFRLRLAPAIVNQVEFFVHWGRLSVNPAAAEWWTDEEVAPDEISAQADGTYVISKRLSAERSGIYGATCCAQAEGTRERVWASQAGGLGDARFSISAGGFSERETLARLDIIENIDVKGKLLQGLASFENFVRTISQLAKTPSCRGLGRLLFEVTKGSPVLRGLVSEYYQRSVLELEQSKGGPAKARLKTTVGVLKNIGIGEVVFVAPEGPHAIAGGLAQVIVGLTKSLSRCGVSCTVITPMYEEAQGNKHSSAKELLARGVQVVDKIVPIKHIGEVKIRFGGTQRYGTAEPWQFPRSVRAQVYMAENEGVRIIFLRHSKLAHRLYPPGWADDQIRRAIFLSRGALEVLRERKFNIAPHIIVSNDWPTALVPVFLRTDHRYREDSRFHGVETVHIMHNCGHGYQGKFPTNQFGEDLYPMLGIGGEHFFGLSDPQNGFLFNFTAGAVSHSNKALVAVSKPYARQLLTRKGGEGLHALFNQAEGALFGVSNGVDLVALRNLFWQVGESARREIGLNPLIRKRLDHKRLIKNLPEYKRVTKQVVQRKYGLEARDDAILISLVGRLAEQKGIQLLAGRADGHAASVLESVLQAFPRVQFFIGGPPSDGDAAVSDLQFVMSDLTTRYPGRIKGVFDFIAHKDALEITQASDIFLMPSRYEPGGITQLEAMAAGTLVVARNVGGIAATLSDYNPERDEGNSFLFKDFSSSALKAVIWRAIEIMANEQRRKKLIARAAVSENDWSHRVPKYLSILQHVAGVFDPRSYYAHLAPRWHLLNSLRATS